MRGGGGGQERVEQATPAGSVSRRRAAQTATASDISASDALIIGLFGRACGLQTAADGMYC